MNDELKLDLPKGCTNPRIVLGYNNEIRLMVDTPDDAEITWKSEDYKKLRKAKIDYLEHFIGYKIEKLDDIIPQDKFEEKITPQDQKEYEKSLESS